MGGVPPRDTRTLEFSLYPLIPKDVTPSPERSSTRWPPGWGQTLALRGRVGLPWFAWDVLSLQSGSPAEVQLANSFYGIAKQQSRQHLAPELMRREVRVAEKKP